MTFDAYLVAHKKAGGTQKGLGISIGISEQAMSRIVNKKQSIGTKMIKRIVVACGGEVSMGELCKEFRPDIYKMSLPLERSC